MEKRRQNNINIADACRTKFDLVLARDMAWDIFVPHIGDVSKQLLRCDFAGFYVANVSQPLSQDTLVSVNGSAVNPSADLN